MFFGDWTFVVGVLFSLATVAMFVLRCAEVIKWSWWIVAPIFVVVILFWGFVFFIWISIIT